MVCGGKCEGESCFHWYVTEKQYQNCKRVQTSPDKACPVHMSQSCARFIPTEQLDSGLANNVWIYIVGDNWVEFVALTVAYHYSIMGNDKL